MDALSSAEARRQESSHEELPLRLVWDKSRLEYDVATGEEPIEELLTMQIHPINLTKTTKIRALLLNSI